jgi:hypothetical protein
MPNEVRVYIVLQLDMINDNIFSQVTKAAILGISWMVARPIPQLHNQKIV